MIIMALSAVSWFWLVTSAALVVAYFIDQHPSVPNIWRSLFRWGKMRVGVVKESGKQFYKVPKRWFQHFYVIGIAANASLLLLLGRKVFWDEPWPSLLSSFLECLQYPASYTDRTDALPVMLVLAMEGMQVCRRCYETFFVNVFSKTATMTLFHYVLGLVFYLSIGVCVLAGVHFQHLQFPSTISVLDGTVYAVAFFIFTSASQLQHESFKILAALRTDMKDKSKQTGYLCPRGGLFDVVSCPHFLAEIIIYFSFCIVFRFQHTILLSLFTFVLVNQVLASLLTHQWYCQNFPAYGKNRHAVFPYLL